jgi:hypothetical protein
LAYRLGLDGHFCGFLEVEFLTLVERVQKGGSDQEILKWCYISGRRPNAVQEAHLERLCVKNAME